MAAPLASKNALGKRKRRDDDDGDYKEEADLFVSDDDNDNGYDSDNDMDDNKPVQDDDFDFDDDADGLDKNPDAIYNERQEPFPEHAAFDPELPKLAVHLVSIVKETIKVIEATPCNTEHVQNNLTKAQGLLEVPKPKPIKIALLGDTGAGKSSLLNSIIDIPGLAKAMGSGESCTCVATEYCGAFPHQQKKFAAEIEYFDIAAIREILADQLDAYAVYHYRRDVCWSDDLRLQHKRKADTAFETFCAVFCKQKEFKSEEAAIRNLREGSNEEETLAKMCKWAEELLGPDGKGAAEKDRYCEADTRRQFDDEIQPLLSSDSDDNEPSLWPFVKLVRIGVRGSRVLDNVTIADLPGISYTNQVKVNACLDHLRTCECLWIVAPIARAIDNSTVDSLVARFEERFRHKMAIICTRSDDDITKSLAVELETKKNKMTAYKKYVKTAKNSQEYITSIRGKIRQRLQALDTDMRAEKVQKLRTELDGYLKKKREATDNAWLAIVEARNNKVVAGLERSMGGHMNEGHKLKIFCVSNEHYRSFKFGDKKTKFQLHPSKTGIPALRKYALSLAADGKLQAYEDYIKFSLTVFMKGLSLWTISHYVEGAAELLAIVQRPQEEVPVKLQEYRNELTTNAKDELEHQIISRADKWKLHALHVIERKRRENHWATNKAFMKKDGKYQTSTVPKESWNEQFSDPARRYIDKAWGRVNTAQAHAILKAETILKDELEQMQEKVMGQEAVKALEMDSFVAMLQGQVVGIENAFRDHHKNYALEMKNLKLDATQNRHTGFFTQAMQAGYEKCKADSGTGSVQRSNDYLIEHISREGRKSPFVVTGDLMTGAISYNAVTQCKALERELINIFKDIYNHFDGMIDKEEDDPEEKPVRAALKEHFKTALPRFEELKKEFEKIKQKTTFVEIKDEPKDE